MAFQPPTEVMSAKGSPKTGEFRSCACLPLHPTLGAAEQKRTCRMLCLCEMLLTVRGLPLGLLFLACLALSDLQEPVKCFKERKCR